MSRWTNPPSSTSASPPSSTSANPPIVLVPGFLAGPPELYWGLQALRSRYPDQRFIQVCPGPLSSHHDRACEIYAQIKGGRVDYGEEHAREHGHARFGRDYGAGLFPEWDAEHPVHLLGHSIGGVTCRVLQQWLHNGLCGPGAANWVLSLTVLSSPLNGDPVVHRLGASMEKPGEVAWGSCGFWLTTATHLLSFLDLPIPLVDLQLEHWHLSRKYGFSAVRRLVQALLWQRSIGQGEDNAASELSFHSMLRLNRQLCTFTETTYFSFAAQRHDLATSAAEAIAAPRAVAPLAPCRMAPCMRTAHSATPHAGGAELASRSSLARLCSSACVGAFAAVVRGDGRLKGWRGSGFREEDWLASDGLLSVRTQRHPLNQPWRPMAATDDELASMATEATVTAPRSATPPGSSSASTASCEDCEGYQDCEVLATPPLPPSRSSRAAVAQLVAGMASVVRLGVDAALGTAWRRVGGLLPSTVLCKQPLTEPAFQPLRACSACAMPPPEPKLGSFAAGVWHVQILQADHFEIAGMAGARQSVMFERFWDAHIAKLQAVAQAQRE